jgi:putative transcriptional regulator
MKNLKNRSRSLAFDRIKRGLENAIAHAHGRKVMRVREVELPEPPRPMKPAQIVALRMRIGASQGVFARMINASPQTIQAWEQGRAKPSGPTLKLLRIIDANPEIVGDLVEV